MPEEVNPDPKTRGCKRGGAEIAQAEYGGAVRDHGAKVAARDVSVLVGCVLDALLAG